MLSVLSLVFGFVVVGTMFVIFDVVVDVVGIDIVVVV